MMKSEQLVEHKAAGEALNNPQRIRAALLHHIALNNNILMISLFRFWARQALEITNDVIAQSLSAGVLDPSITESWKDDWQKFLSSQIDDLWTTATLEGASKMQRELRIADKKVLSRILDSLRQWREARRAHVTEKFASTQRAVAGNLVRSLGIERGANVRETRRIVRASLGLTRRQARALVAIWDTLQEEGVVGLARATRIVGETTRLQAVRARRIAKTELALAFNAGAHEQVREHIAEGSMLESKVIKIWVTAGDSNVCGFCQTMAANAPLAFSDTFPGKNWAEGASLNPPAHPSCRCVIEYRDVS